MAAVAAVAINLAVMRSFDETRPDSLSHLFFASGVVPVGSVLLLLALFSAPNLARGGWLSPFVLGFETLGSVAVFAFITCYSMIPSAILEFTEWTGAWTRPILIPLFAGSPRWVQISIELGFGVIWFSLPQLMVALLGGWLNRKLGLTLRFDLRVKDAGRLHASLDDSFDP
jgi:hypothetical protein